MKTPIKTGNAIAIGFFILIAMWSIMATYFILTSANDNSHWAFIVMVIFFGIIIPTLCISGAIGAINDSIREYTNYKNF